VNIDDIRKQRKISKYRNLIDSFIGGTKDAAEIETNNIKSAYINMNRIIKADEQLTKLVHCVKRSGHLYIIKHMQH
jgi:dimeric dUTPase (all-alpha-NTP-PPase superfamily)